MGRLTDRTGEQGAVSIFIVVFFALLLGVITISFIGIVIRNVTQSTNNDLSRSAYDSAQAGVEDAKRAIALTTNECLSNGSACGQYSGYLDDDECHALPSFSTTLGLSQKSPTEIKVQNDSNATLDQSYTCVNVTMNTPDYVNNKSPYESDVIPLNSTSDFSGININWFTHSDAGTTDDKNFTPRDSCNVNSAGSDCRLPKEADWDQNASAKYTPALLRLELISYTNGAITADGLQDETKTVFLYPTNSGASVASFPVSQPPAANNQPPIVPVTCGGHAEYACNIKLALASAPGKTQFLRVTPVYKKTTFQLELTGSSNPLFKGVQPIVDSTGRANDLFRRVQARVQLGTDVLYPEYAVSVNNSLCKDFSVGADAAEFQYRCN